MVPVLCSKATYVWQSWFAGAAGAASTSAPRLLVVLGSGASAALVEEFAGADEASAYFCNAVAEVVLGEDAQLMHGCAACCTVLSSVHPLSSLLPRAMRLSCSGSRPAWRKQNVKSLCS